MYSYVVHRLYMSYYTLCFQLLVQRTITAKEFAVQSLSYITVYEVALSKTISSIIGDMFFLFMETDL